MQVRLLGTVELVGGSGAVAVGGPKERAVLAVLALRAGETVSEDSLIEALWGDAPPPSAVKTLRAYVSRLRRLLADHDAGELGIETTPGGYLLRTGTDGRDVDEIAALLESARAAVAAGDVVWAALAFGRVLQAWRGRPLGEFADEPFARAEAARLEELRQLVVEERIDAELACGHHAALLSELDALTRAYPLRERLWAQRMTALYRAGRQAEALQVYQQLRATLGEELGIDPNPTLVELHTGILQQQASLDWVPIAQPEPPPAAPDVELPSGVVTFLLTDVEGSTALWEAHGEAMRTALARHDEILGAVVRQHGGVLVKPRGEGDSAFAVFATASDAVSSALAAQRALAAEAWPDSVSLRVRMAIHTGQAQLRDGDYFGSTVNRAARLRELAHGGQIVLSRATADVLGDEHPADVELIDLGEHRLRDLSRPERVFQLAHPALRAVFPSLRADQRDATNLPAQTTTFIGRVRQLADVAAALEVSRVVTLTGLGGVGKTRLALEVAAKALPGYRDGVWLVELAPTVDPAVIIEVIATALAVTQRQGQTLAASVLDFLRAKRLLLVLDNCEHLLDAVAGFVDEVLHACPYVRVMATSREGLGVAGERMIAVPSLQLPTAAESTPRTEAGEDAEAVLLFVARAVEANADFALTDKNRAAVAQLCRRLDGIPLAIELAAARVRSLSPADLAARVDERFRLLAGGPRTAVERHQTLRRAIDWSYDLLAATEQHALNRLAVFAGSFDLAAAETVLPGEGIGVDDVVDLLGRLVDKSLVVVDQDCDTRYRLLETIRAYAQDRLEASGELAALRRRHAAHYVAFSARAGDGIRGPEEVSWTPRIDAELDNLRAALAWSAAAGDADVALRLIAPLALHGCHAGYASAPWAAVAIDLPNAPVHPLYPEVLAWAGLAAETSGEHDRALRLTQQAIDLADARPLEAESRMRVMLPCSVVTMWSGQLEDAKRLTGELLELARTAGDDLFVTSALNLSGVTRLFSGEAAEAIPYLDEALAVARRLRNPSALTHAANMAGECRIEIDPDRARNLLDEALRAATSVDNRLAMGINVACSVYLHLALDDWPEAARRVLFAGEYLHRAGDSIGLRGLCVPGAITVLARVGADEPAAKLCGAARMEMIADQVARHFPIIVAGLRDRLGEHRCAEYAAMGAAMDDDEIFSLVQAEINARLTNGT